jgi:hypothetical protein
MCNPADTSKKVMMVAMGVAKTSHCQSFSRTIALYLSKLELLYYYLWYLIAIALPEPSVADRL